MSRIGYAILAILGVLLGLYLWWPASEETDYRQVWEGTIPESYTLVTPELRQAVSGDQVQLAGLKRKLDPAAERRLWQLFTSMRANRSRPISESELAAYGIGAHRLYGEGVDLRWGHTAEQTYVYNAMQGQVSVLHRDTYQTIARAAGRLDDQSLLPPDLQVNELTVDDLTITHTDGRWLAPQAPERPAFTTRVQGLVELLRSLRLQRLPADQPAISGSKWGSLITVSDGEEMDVSLRFNQDEDDRVWVLADDLPAQPLPMRERFALAEAVAAFARDPLFELPVEGVNPSLQRVEIWRDGSWWMSIEPDRDNPSAEQPTFWLRWSLGRERINTRALWRLQQSLAELVVDNVERLDAGQPLADWLAEHAEHGPHIHIRAWDARDRLRVDVHLRDHYARSHTHQGRVTTLPPMLAELQPAAFIDTRLLRLNPERISKFQRVYYDDQDQASAEVFARRASTWQQRHPQLQAVNDTAVERLVQSIVEAEASAVRFATIDRAPQRSLALRIRGREVGDGRDESDLLDTVDRDWGLNLYRRDDGDWDAAVVDAGMVYVLPHNLVADWFAPLAGQPVLPVLANQILGLEVESDRHGDYTLRRTSDGQWRLQYDGNNVLADTSEVRRLLASLVHLQATSHQPSASLLSTDRVQQRLVVLVPGVDESTDRLVLSFASVDGDEQEISLHRQGAQPRSWGRFYIDTAKTGELFAPPRRYAPLAGEQLQSLEQR